MKKILLSISILFCAAMSYSQSGLLRKETDIYGTISFAEFRNDSLSKSMSESKQLLKQLIGAEEYDELTLTDSKTDELGFTHHYYIQYYKGIRVAYGSYSVHGRDDMINTVNGTFHKVGKVEIIPNLTEKEALNFAIASVNAKSYKWEIPEEEQWLNENYNKSYYPIGELVIVEDRMKKSKKFLLSWKFDIYAHTPISRNLIYVDAVTGEIIDTESKIHHANSPGTGATRYSGARNIITDSFLGEFRLRETRNNVRIETYNMRNQGTNYSGALDFTDNNNDWTGAEFNNINMDNAALDAHWGTEMVHDYFNIVHNRNSWNGSGGPLLNYVHANLISFGLSDNGNAFWDGHRMTYGDGNFCFNVLTSLDVVAHEIGHGINSSSAKIRYEGESGAINESLSDIWAACVEQWSAPEKQTWLLAEDISLCGGAMRSLSNPSSISYTLDGVTSTYPDTYNGNGYYTGISDNGGVHINSSVSNYWFFLLVNGGTGTNDIGNCFQVSGISMNDAARIVYRAETVILSSSSEQTVTFSQFRDATITAASNLFGAYSAQKIAVTNAWYAVGVGSEYVYTSNDISGSPIVCTTGVVVTLNNSPIGATITWSATPTNIFAIGSNSGNGVTATPAARSSSTSGSGIITFTINSSCGNPIQVQRTIWVGRPANLETIAQGLDSSAPYYVCKNTTYQFNAFDFTNISGTTYGWQTYGNHTIVSYNGSGNITANIQTGNTPNGTYISARAQNTCGNSAWADILLYEQTVGCSGGGGLEFLSVHPNPADDYLDIEIDDSKYNAIEFPLFEIVLFDNTGNEKMRTTTNSKLKRIDTSGLENGHYFLHILYNEEEIQRQIIIKR